MAVPKLKTWSALSHTKRMPTEYEIVTHRLHYHTKLGFEVDPDAPVAKWYRKYRDEAALQASDWDQFRDPHQMIYRKYTELQDDRETFIDVLLDEAELREDHTKLNSQWIECLAQMFTPFRYPGHGFQMLAAYGAQMAPSSYITNCFEFEAGDEMRRVQRIAYRTKQLDSYFPSYGFGTNDRKIWENAPIWQPLREAVEKLLIEYDWSKSFIAYNLVVKPYVDELVLVHFADLCRLNDDHVHVEMLGNFYLDSLRNQDWTIALTQFAIEQNPGNLSVITETIRRWKPLAEQATKAFRPVFEDMSPVNLAFDSVFEDINHTVSDLWRGAGVKI
ncbi:toluene monooxygenase [Kyrpidia spormannii]|uniref:Alkene monooxygenase system, oxygenase component subunit beta n=2 Tax=Kyrpidia spormannii TaxID=2055160 RepID=A0ACA8ZAQ3_9BACL|nr:toluene monooxygenase [Kyrpidia spormannii]CAB3393609.1 Alkene monooxygenase system, oxygenase component subunit beta [Kyrpidia spormannii]CAB3394531.1 Alkene monooxygenase system, oxygenase component subunit beta [Kyrpidia spormannii]